LKSIINQGGHMNKKGHLILGVAYLHLTGAASTALTANAVALALATVCMWHIPAWEKAKANHTEAAYQSQEMFPQQLFDKLPGGTPGRTVGQFVSGNGGNLAGGFQNGG